MLQKDLKDCGLLQVLECVLMWLWYSSSFRQPLESKDKLKIKCQVSESILYFSLISWLKIHQSSILRTSERQMNLRSAICQEQYALNLTTVVYKEHLHKGIACHLKPLLRCSKERILQRARVYGAWSEGTLILLNAKQARNKLIPQ